MVVCRQKGRNGDALLKYEKDTLIIEYCGISKEIGNSDFYKNLINDFKLMKSTLKLFVEWADQKKEAAGYSEYMRERL